MHFKQPPQTHSLPPEEILIFIRPNQYYDIFVDESKQSESFMKTVEVPTLPTFSHCGEKDQNHPQG